MHYHSFINVALAMLGAIKHTRIPNPNPNPNSNPNPKFAFNPTLTLTLTITVCAVQSRGTPIYLNCVA